MIARAAASPGNAVARPKPVGLGEALVLALAVGAALAFVVFFNWINRKEIELAQVQEAKVLEERQTVWFTMLALQAAMHYFAKAEHERKLEQRYFYYK